MADARDRIAVRPVSPDDLAVIEQIDFEADAEADWRYGGSVPGPAERRARLWSQAVLDQRLIVWKPSGAALGYGTVYDHNTRCGTAWLAVAAAPRFKRTGFATFGLGVYITTVFREWPLRRLYAEGRGTSFDHYSRALDGTAVVSCGRLVDGQAMGDGSYRDIEWLMIERDPWMARYG